MPTLKATCGTFVAVAAACVDYPVARGPEVDRCLDAGGEGTMATSFIVDLKGTGAWKSNPCAPAIERTAPHLKTPRNEYIAILVHSGDSFFVTDVGHEYGHLLFQLHSKEILPKYLPKDGAPVMTEMLFTEALEEEIRQDTQVGQDEKEHPGLLHEQLKDYLRYLAEPHEEFARGFELAAYDDEKDPDGTLDGFLEQQRQQRLRQAKVKNPDYSGEFYMPLYLKRYSEILWERYVGTE
jgi:hypothetical protein